MPTSYAEARQAAREMTAQEVDETLDGLFDMTTAMFAASAALFHGTDYEGYVCQVADAVTDVIEHIAQGLTESRKVDEPALSR
jgi:hypothetical protein